MEEEWSREKEEILCLLGELEKMGIHELVSKIAVANDLVEKYKQDKAILLKLNLGIEHLKTQFQEKLVGSVSQFQKLLEKKAILERRITLFEAELNKLEGLAMIENEFIKSDSHNDAAKTHQYLEQIHEQITNMHTSMKEAKEWFEKISLTIAAYEENISKMHNLELPPEICKRYRHPPKFKREVGSGRKTHEGWYCPNCKEFVDEDI